MNFQAPNIAQKFSGYVVGSSWPTPAPVTTLGPLAGSHPGLADAFDYVDGALRRMLDALDAAGLTDSTLIIVTSKHGNSPVDPADLHLIDPATTLVPIINGVQAGLAAQVTDDTNALIWLKDHSRAPEVAAALQRNAATIGRNRFIPAARSTACFTASSPAIPPGGPTSSSSRCRASSTLVREASSPITADFTRRTYSAVRGGLPYHGAGTVAAPVSLRQLAPTILHALHLKKNDLDAVRAEHTAQLPGLDDDDNDR